MDLIPAVKRGDIVRVRELLDSGEDPNTREHYTNRTALMIASEYGHTEIIRLLLDRGADINSQNDSYTALIKASMLGKGDMAEFLLVRGADPNIQNIKGDTALMNAARYSNSILNLEEGTDYIKVVELLLRHGADPNIRNWNGKTASMIAERVGADDIARLIRDHFRLQKAKQRLAFATYLLGDNTPMDDLDYDVTTRIADYLHDLDQYGSGSKRSSSRSSSRSEQSRRSRRKRIKNKYYTRRRSFF
tara:strand:- start:109 stop:849 length:741 start_codon:yes stop_codon:yes gene_type:complete